MALPLPWNWCYTPSQIDAAALMAASMRSQELQTRSQLRIKQKPRYLYDSAAWAYLLVGPARFELATNGLKVRKRNQAVTRMVKPFRATLCLIKQQQSGKNLPIEIRLRVLDM